MREQADQKVRTLDTWDLHMGTILSPGEACPANSEPKRLTSYSCPWLGSPRSQQPTQSLLHPGNLYGKTESGVEPGGRVHTQNLGAQTPSSPSPRRPEQACNSQQPPAERPKLQLHSQDGPLLRSSGPELPRRHHHGPSAHSPQDTSTSEGWSGIGTVEDP